MGVSPRWDHVGSYRDVTGIFVDLHGLGFPKYLFIERRYMEIYRDTIQVMVSQS